MADKIPPHNLEAERSVLGAGMLSREGLSEILETVKADDFYSGANKEIFQAMRSLFDDDMAVDIITVGDELKKKGVLEAVGGRAGLASLTSDVPSITNAVEYARIVAEKADIRRLILAADKIKEKSYSQQDSARSILDYAEGTVFEIGQEKQKSDYTSIREVLRSNIDQIDENVKNRGKISGVATGFDKLDSMTSGLQKSDLIIVAARPSMGKTAFALNIAKNAAIKEGASVMIFSLEMSKEQLGMRLLSMEANVDMEKMKKGAIDPEDWDRISLGMDSLGRSKMVIDDSVSINVYEIRNKCRRRKAMDGLDLVIIDYLQLFQGDGRSENRQQEISSWSRNLKLIAREIECPIVVLSQLSRGPENRPNHHPMLSDLRESGSIEQDADIVMFLYRDEYYNEDTDKPGICEISIDKHRNGPTGKLDLAWIARYTKFANPAGIEDDSRRDV